jgi:hypothetical protein
MWISVARCVPSGSATDVTPMNEWSVTRESVASRRANTFTGCASEMWRSPDAVVRVSALSLTSFTVPRTMLSCAVADDGASAGAGTRVAAESAAPLRLELSCEQPTTAAHATAAATAADDVNRI